MRTIKLALVNCCGEVGDVIISGANTPPGETVFEKSQFIRNDRKLWHFVLNEPRGGVFRHVNRLVPSNKPSADIGFVIIEPMDIPPMSGSNAICVATVLLEKGIIPITQKNMKMTLEAPGGLIKVNAKCNRHKVESVRIKNLPSFVLEFEREILVNEIGKIIVSTAYGGDSFVLVNSAQINIPIVPKNAARIVSICSRIVKAANEQIGFSHPLVPNLKEISFCMLMDPVKRTEEGIKTARNTVCIRPKKLDRSPCGTGSSARLAYMHCKNEISLKEPFISESILGTKFECQITNQGKTHGTNCITPEIKGQAWITGEQTLNISHDDPFPYGYRLTDTWPEV